MASMFWLHKTDGNIEPCFHSICGKIPTATEMPQKHKRHFYCCSLYTCFPLSLKKNWIKFMLIDAEEDGNYLTLIVNTEAAAYRASGNLSNF